MTVLVVNAGSSSVKFTLFGPDASTRLATGIVERIGLPDTRLRYENHLGDSLQAPVRVKDADEAVEKLLAALTAPQGGVLDSFEQITAVGHRVVHGGERLTRPVVIDGEIKNIISQCARLAPLHNPPNLGGILASEKRLPGVPHVAVFDTAFHATIPEHAFLYGLPYELYRVHGIRRYGFHGISHSCVSREAARFLGAPLEMLKIASCHLGNGCSVTAVSHGRSVDTSMGFTPLEGLIMGTRCGDLDPAVVLHLMESLHLTVEGVNDLLNKRSGLFGLAEIDSHDLRDVLSAVEDGSPRADGALRAFCYRIAKYVGAYTAAMGGLDVLVFTAGIGENSPEVRRRVCCGTWSLRRLGVVLDQEKNAASGRRTREISAAGSPVRVLVVPTDEEQEIARETLLLLDCRSTDSQPF